MTPSSRSAGHLLVAEKNMRVSLEVLKPRGGEQVLPLWGLSEPPAVLPTDRLLDELTRGLPDRSATSELPI